MATSVNGLERERDPTLSISVHLVRRVPSLSRRRSWGSLMIGRVCVSSWGASTEEVISADVYSSMALRLAVMEYLDPETYCILKLSDGSNTSSVAGI